MCLTLKFKTEKARERAVTPKIAKKDIKVYKLIKVGKNNKWYPPFRRNNKLVYVPGFIYYQDYKNGAFSIRKDKRDWQNNPYRLLIDRGLHSFKILAEAKWRKCTSTTEIIVECIIPKGSQYYSNSIEIVSNQLMIPHNPKIYK